MGKRVLGGFIGSLVLGSGLLGWPACGGSVATTPDGSTRDGAQPEAGPETITSDSPSLPDASIPETVSIPDVASGDAPGFGGDGAILCPSAPCPNSELCCVIPPGDGGALTGGDGGAFQCMAECPDGGGEIQCEGPEGCSASTPECCATVSVVGSGMACSASSAATQCVATCTEVLSTNPFCPATDTVKLCRSSADCTSDPNYPACCQTPYTGALAFCAPTLIHLLPGAVCN
jgi:hypothetical protein